MIEIEQRFEIRYEYPVCFTRDAFGAGEETLLGVFRRAGTRRQRVLPVVDAGLLAADPGLSERIRIFGDRHPDVVEWVAPPVPVRGGEACKQDLGDVARLHELVERHRICRQSYFLAVGGGAVLDAVGYAAATAHRGVRLVRMPSTVLAQNDAGIGVKNAINAFGRKNFIGSFAPPFAVVNDLDLLDTLSHRDRIGGIAEAVKVALIKDVSFFEELYAARQRLARLEANATERMIVRCAELHLEHIRTSGDPFEMGSARPLDFGHWAAHRLEELSEGDLRHGEAVAIGVALDSLYSHAAGRLDELSLRRILLLLEELGFGLAHPALRWLDVESALQSFREHLGGELCVTLLDAIGRGVEVHEIDAACMRDCVSALLRRGAGEEASRNAGPLPDVRQGRP